MFSKKIRLNAKGKSTSVATALVLLAIEELIEDKTNDINWVYGYQIMSHLKDAFNWKNVKSGTVYPILKKLDEENYIRKGVGPDIQRQTKRQTIYYKITNKGKKLASKIKSLNDEALEEALSSGEKKDQKKSKQFQLPSFPKSGFTEEYLIPFLLNFDLEISQLVKAHITKEEISELREDINKSIAELDEFKNLLKVHLSKIDKIEQIK